MMTMMMSLSRSGIESTQKRDVEKPSREEEDKKRERERESNERRRRTGFHEDLHESRLCVRACVRALSRERDERKCPAFLEFRSLQKQVIFSPFFRRRRRRMMTTMAICPSSSSMTTTTFSALHCWRHSGGTRRRCLLVARGRGERERERDAFGERDVLKRLAKLKRAVAQNRTKDTVPTAETIGMRFSEVLQSCSISIYVVSFDRVDVGSRENSFYLFPIRFSLGGEASFCSLGVVSLTARCFSLLYYVQ